MSVLINENKLTAIGTAIRNKKGTASAMTLDEMASEIASIPTSSASVTYSSLSVSGDFTNTQWTGEVPDTIGITANALFSASETLSDPTAITLSGTGSKVVTPSVSPATWGSTEGSQTASFSYTYNGVTKTTTKSVTVYKKLASITLTTAPTGSQHAGQAIDFTGLKITASYTDGTTGDVTASVTKDKTTWDSTASSQTVTFTFTKNGITKTCTWTTTPSAISLTGLSVSGDWTNTQYVSTAVDYTGLTFTATYSNGSTSIVTPTSMSPTAWSSTVGTQTCTFTYTENGVSKTCTKDASVQQQPVSALPVGGRIFFINQNSTGATYTFYDSSMNEITDQSSISALANATYYRISGTPNTEKFYVYDNTNGLVSNKEWGANNVSVGIDSTGIGYGKTNTAVALATEACFVPSYGDETIWKWLRDTINANNTGGCNDWFIGTMAEQTKLRLSGLVDWYNSSNSIWAAAEYSQRYSYLWYKNASDWDYNIKTTICCVVAMRSF